MATPRMPRPRARRQTGTPPTRARARARSSSDDPHDLLRPLADAHADDDLDDAHETSGAETPVSRADADTLQRYLRAAEAVPLLTRVEEVAVATMMATGTQRVRDLVLPLPVTVRSVLAIMQEAPADAARQLFDVDEHVPPQELTQRLAQVAARVPLLRILAQQSRPVGQTIRGTRAASVGETRHRTVMALADLGLANHLMGSIVRHLRHQTESLSVNSPAAHAFHATRQRAVEDALGMTIADVTTVLARITQAQHEAATARHCLIEANMCLVPPMARHYVGRGLDLVDLIQEGNIGLTHAVDKFDARRGYLLATYARWWIKSAILRALDKAHLVTPPRRLLELKPMVARATVLLVRELGREPTPRELAQVLTLPLETVDAVLQTTAQIVSLEAPIGEDGALTVGDLLADPQTPSPAAVVEARESFALANQAVQTLLTPAEARALRHRLGLPPAPASNETAATADPAVARGRLSRGTTQALRTLRATLQPDAPTDARRHKK